MTAAFAPLFWALAGLVTIFLLTRAPRPTDAVTRIELNGSEDVRPAA